MKLKEIIDFIDEKIPENLALESDNVGLMGSYDLNNDINSIKILMDFWPEDDDFGQNTLIITHHPPLFTPKTATYTVHSNWDIIDGGANDALAKCLDLDVIDYFDDETNIGRICRANRPFNQLKATVLENFEDVRIVNDMDGEKTITKVGIVSGFGLKNPEYVRLAGAKKLDLLISGDLVQESAILAKNLGVTLMDLGHHESEVPGLYALKHFLEEIDIETEVIDKKPITKL